MLTVRSSHPSGAPLAYAPVSTAQVASNLHPRQGTSPIGLLQPKILAEAREGLRQFAYVLAIL